MHYLISSLERVAVFMKRMIDWSWEVSKRSVEVHEYYVCVARQIAAMTTSQMNPSIVLRTKNPLRNLIISWATPQ